MSVRVGCLPCASLLSAILLAATGCDAGGGSSSRIAAPAASDPPAELSIGGAVTGLSGAGLVLQLNALEELAVEANGPFVFSTALEDGSEYAVTVASQPLGQTCTVANGSGTAAGDDVTDIAVSCELTLARDMLVATDDAVPPVLYAIDRANGAAEAVSRNGLRHAAVTGLAYDPITQTVYGTDAVTGDLLSIDPSTGAAAVIGNTGSENLLAINGLAFDPLAEVLYGVESGTGLLVTMDTGTGKATVLDRLAFVGTNVEGLAFVYDSSDPLSGRLYAADTIRGLIRIHPRAGNVTVEVVGSLESVLVGLAFDAESGVLYANGSLKLYAVDTDTARLTEVPPRGYHGLTNGGLAFDGDGGVFYATETWGALYRISLASGVEARSVGSTGTFGIGGLAFDSRSDRILGVDQLLRRLIELDPATGEATILSSLVMAPGGVLPAYDVQSIAFDSASGTLYGIRGRFARADELVTIDAASGETTIVGALVGQPDAFVTEGVAFRPPDGLLFTVATETTASGARLSHLYALRPGDPGVLAPRRVTEVGVVSPPAEIAALAVDDRGTLFGADATMDQVVLVDPDTAEIRPVGPTARGLQGLTFR